MSYYPLYISKNAISVKGHYRSCQVRGQIRWNPWKFWFFVLIVTKCSYIVMFMLVIGHKWLFKVNLGQKHANNSLKLLILHIFTFNAAWPEMTLRDLRVTLNSWMTLLWPYAYVCMRWVAFVVIYLRKRPWRVRYSVFGHFLEILGLFGPP